MKPCICCGEEKPLDEYYTHPRMTDGHLNKCKECVKAYQRTRRIRLLETDPNWVRREAQRCREKARREYRAIRHTSAYQERMRQARADWEKRNPDKRSANHLVRSAIRNGTLVKPNQCELCGAGPPIHGHHEDYSEPLIVVWVCVKCHGELHRKAA